MVWQRTEPAFGERFTLYLGETRTKDKEKYTTMKHLTLNKLFPIFYKYTSGKPDVREQPNYYINDTVQNKPAWIKYLIQDNNMSVIQNLRWMTYTDQLKCRIKSAMRSSSEGISHITYEHGPKTKALFIFHKWIPLTAKKLHYFNILESCKARLLRSPDGKPGLTDVFLETCRIKSFRLIDAILYSYWFDLRFVLFLSLFHGFSMFMIIAPDLIILNNPIALCSPDIKLIIQVVKDTYVIMFAALTLK